MKRFPNALAALLLSAGIPGSSPGSWAAISDYSATPSGNSSIAGINIAEGMAPGNVNDAIRQLMADLKAGIGAPLTGSLIAYAGAAAPDGWLLAYGQCVSRTTYAALFAAIGTAHGACDGSTTFALPDMRGRVIAGKDDMGGAAASRLTNAGGVAGATLGASGGAQTLAIAQANLPNVTLSVSATSSTSLNAISSHIHGPNRAVLVAGAGTGPFGNGGSNTGYGVDTLDMQDHNPHNHSVTVTGSTSALGSGTAVTQVQPTIVMNWIIKH